jgi:putative salt-induced outer membrane protein YdiY
MAQNKVFENRWLRLFALLFFATSAHAGVLVLSNGDRISGELIVISDGQMHWQSDMAGEITVPQENVLTIEARDLFEVEIDTRRQLSECQLQVRGDQTQLLNCKEGEAPLDSWKRVSKVSARPLIKRDLWRNTGYVSASAKDSAGNTDEQDLALDLKMSARRGSIRHSVAAAYNTQTQSDLKTSDDRKAEYQYDHFVSDKWYLNGLLSWERNVFQDLESRRLVAGGLGYQFFDTDLIRLAVDGGVGYVTEQYSSDDDRKAMVFRENTDFTYRLNALGLQFFHRNTYLLMFDRNGDWRFQSETGFKLPVIGRLTAQTKFKFDYANIPANDTHAMDRTWLFGVNYDW